MRVLFIYKYNFIEPIGLMYISSALKKAGHKTFFFDTSLSKGLEEYVDRLRPEVIAFSIVTGNHRYYAEINRSLKKRFSFFSVFGGPHATFFPEFIETDGVDAVCRGEGEQAMVELCEKLSGGESHRETKNFWIKENGNIHKNTLRCLENSLDEIPFPDRDSLYMYPTYKHRANKYVLTSRGCPYGCTYCFNHSLKKLYDKKGRFCRKRSIENVISEIDELRLKAPVEKIQFFDDVFILDKKWVLEFSEIYRKRIGLPFICYVRVNLVDEDIIAALKNAGVVTITFAIETGNEQLRNNVLKRNITEEQIIKTAELLHRYDIRFFTQNMLALPGEKIENAFETLRLNIRCRPSFAIASIFQPYPGTELTAYAIDKGMHDGSKEIEHDSFYEKSILKIPDHRQFENLSWLFPLGVLFPGIFNVLKRVIKFPLGYIYKAVWNVGRCYGYFFRIHWIPLKDVIRTSLTMKVKGGMPVVEK